MPWIECSYTAAAHTASVWKITNFSLKLCTLLLLLQIEVWVSLIMTKTWFFIESIQHEGNFIISSPGSGKWVIFWCNSRIHCSGKCEPLLWVISEHAASPIWHKGASQKIVNGARSRHDNPGARSTKIKGAWGIGKFSKGAWSKKKSVSKRKNYKGAASTEKWKRSQGQKIERSREQGGHCERSKEHGTP